VGATYAKDLGAIREAEGQVGGKLTATHKMAEDQVGAPDGPYPYASQADSAGSIPVTRSTWRNARSGCKLGARPLLVNNS
jgi:hypothetical protein